MGVSDKYIQRCLSLTCFCFPATDGSRKKRKRDPGKPKRQQTAYTCFVSENYELIKKNHDPNMPSKDVIALIARQWAATSEEEKVLWKERANVQNTARHEHEDLAEGVAQFVDAAADEGDKGKKKRATTVKKIKVSAAV